MTPHALRPALYGGDERGGIASQLAAMQLNGIFAPSVLVATVATSPRFCSPVPRWPCAARSWNASAASRHLHRTWPTTTRWARSSRPGNTPRRALAVRGSQRRVRSGAARALRPPATLGAHDSDAASGAVLHVLGGDLSSADGAAEADLLARPSTAMAHACRRVRASVWAPSRKKGRWRTSPAWPLPLRDGLSLAVKKNGCADRSRTLAGNRDPRGRPKTRTRWQPKRRSRYCPRTNGCR